jgi:thiamine-phosphate pyrophosphorylase
VAALDPKRLAVYVVTSAGFAGRSHGDLVNAAIDGGATAVQFRAPELHGGALLPLAVDLAERCHAAGVLFIVNDDADVAVSAGADGTHAGQSDDPAGARRVLGPDRVLGVSVGSPAEASRAVELGADYLGVTVWASPTKPDANALGLEGIAEIAATTPLPIVGIGGIDAGNAAEVIAAGASGIAVISAVAATDDPAAATRELRAVVDEALRDRRGAR